MELMQVDSHITPSKDDSGYVPDVSDTPMSTEVTILDLSDDVLLYILRLLSPRDLKALGYSCARLGRLIQDRSLWRYVDARNEIFSTARLEWYLTHTLHNETQVLLITGHAKDCIGCLGMAESTRKTAEEEQNGQQSSAPQSKESAGTNIDVRQRLAEDNISVIRELPHVSRCRQPRYNVDQHFVCLPRRRAGLSWCDDSGMGRSGPQKCIGPQFTVTPQIMRQLRHQCNLTTLSLEYCNVNCNVINLSQFPRTLKSLSLCGTRLYNLIEDRSFLAKITQFLPLLQYINLSECDWVEPSSLLPLSKLEALTHLIARDCLRLTEFVAYASLTARYGFKTLEYLDFRGSPVGDSEVSAFGWLPTLQELWLRAFKKPNIERHAHYTDDEYVPHIQLEEWEVQEPEYYQSKTLSEPIATDEESDSGHVQFDLNDEQPSTSGDDSHRNKSDKDEDKREPKDNMKRDRDTEDKNDDGDDDDDSGDPKRPRRDPGIHVHIDRIKAACRALRPLVEESLYASRNIPGPSNRHEERHTPCCKCPEHTVEKTDKATETDNMDAFGKCGCGKKGSEDGGAEKSDPAKADETAKESNKMDVNQAEENKTSEEDSDKLLKEDNRTPEGGEKASENKDDKNKANDDADNRNENEQQPSNSAYVHFRRNQRPLVMNCPNMAQGVINQVMGNLQRVFERAHRDVCPERPQPSDNVTNKDENETKDNNKNDEGTGANAKEKPDEQQPGPSANPEPSRNQEEPRPSRRLEPNAPFAARYPNLNLLVQNANREIPEPYFEPHRHEVQYVVEPRHHVLYVSVESQSNTFRLPRDFEHEVRHDTRPISHVDPSSLVTDYSIRRFGRADGEDVNFIHFGPHGPVLMGAAGNNSRPDRSNLRVLSVIGYRNITDRSLSHLISAAPHLRSLDLRGTSVTERGVENFRSLRPDCEVVYGPLEEQDKQ